MQFEQQYINFRTIVNRLRKYQELVVFDPYEPSLRSI